MAEINKKKLLAHEARRWIGIKERGGSNKGEFIEAFQKTVDSKAHGEPWCMSFVQFCVGMIDSMIAQVWPQLMEGGSLLFPSEHCATVWNNTPVQCRRTNPSIGLIAVWKNTNGSNGHTGIVVGVESNESFYCVEGNTAPDSYGDEAQREGDGVYIKKRGERIGRLRLLGFIDPWGDL